MTPENKEQLIDFNIGSKGDWERGREREGGREGGKEKEGDMYACTCTLPY